MRRPPGVPVLLLVVTLTACGPFGSARRALREAAATAAPTAAVASPGLRGAITVDGSSTVFPVTQLAAERFRAEIAPGVDIAVGVSGTGGGFSKFCAGEIDIADASRPIKPEEATRCAEHGIEPVELLVGLDGLAVVASPSDTWLECLTVEQLRQLWEEGSPIRRWSDLDPRFPNEPVVLFGPGPDSGTYDFFVEAVLGEDGRPRSDYTASEDDNVLVQGVAGARGALAYFGLAYYLENADRVRLVAIDAGAGCVLPDAATVASGAYPLSRPLYLYVARGALRRPEVTAFLRYYLSHVAEFTTAVGYIPPPDPTATIATLDAALAEAA